MPTLAELAKKINKEYKDNNLMIISDIKPDYDLNIMKQGQTLADITTFKEDLSSLGIYLNELQIKQFIRYYELLVEWNEKMNLTAITEPNEVILKHFVDSLTIKKLQGLRY